MTIWIVFVIYAFVSSVGLYLIKTGTGSTSFELNNGLIAFQLSPRLLLGLAVYACSFLLSIYVLSKMKLTVFYPAGTGAILVVTCILGYFFLQEHIGLWQIGGMVLILAGIVLINIH